MLLNFVKNFKNNDMIIEEDLNKDNITSQLTDKINSILKKSYCGATLNDLYIHDNGDDNILVTIDLNIETEHSASGINFDISEEDIDPDDLPFYEIDEKDYEIDSIKEEIEKITIPNFKLVDVDTDIQDWDVCKDNYIINHVDSGSDSSEFWGSTVHEDYAQADVTFYITAKTVFTLSFERNLDNNLEEGIDKQTSWTRNNGYVDPRTNFQKLRPEVQAKVINGMTWADRKARQEWVKEHEQGYCPNCNTLLPRNGVCDSCGYKASPENPGKGGFKFKPKTLSNSADPLEKLKKNLTEKEYSIFSNAMKNVDEKDDAVNLFEFAKELGRQLNYEPKQSVGVLKKIAELNDKKSDLLNATFKVEYKVGKAGIKLPYKLSLS